MANETPVVRYLIACIEIVVAPDRNSVTLRDVIHAIQPLPGET